MFPSRKSCQGGGKKWKMNSKVKINVDTRKLFYLVTILSVLIFIIGNIITITNNALNIGIFNALSRDYFDILTMFIPFSIWAWLIILGTLFVKKNWIVIITCIVLAIPHIVVIVVMHAYSYSVLDILKWYVMILSFGSITL